MRQNQIQVIFACGMRLGENCESKDNYEEYGGEKPFSWWASNLDSDNMKYFGAGDDNIGSYITRIQKFMESSNDTRFVLLGHSLGADAILGAAADVVKNGTANILGIMLFDSGNRIHNEVNLGFLNRIQNAQIPIFSYLSKEYSIKATQSPNDYLLPSFSSLTIAPTHSSLVVNPQIYLQTVSIYYSMILLGH